ncbi:hypothetical protein TCDM_08360 [Trypanosoma cruzi Dm28c]|uniref:WW domain-containing protein n=1 Tax=Trypanosoma cruzi Dm28c TaxID=1416333 RepID=V5ASG6_TRYCR|nr:hypothetical protein TCDM_08360 [Trypanosoma cruzi Dm28c]
MDIAVSSPLLESLYSECVPLIDIMQRHLRRSNGDHRNGGNVMNRYDGDEEIAFLSSVQAPSELCLALACVSWRREAARRSERGPLLVFVPFHEPKDEVFVEVPVAAFGDSRRQRGLQLLSLNEYSSLFANIKDGLPPRKGFFVTFRTREAQQRFRDAMNHLIRTYSRGGPLEDRNRLLRGMGGSPNVRANHKEGKFSEGGGENVPEAIQPSRDAVVMPRSSRDAIRAASIIDSLLAERDRRREEYISSIHSSPPRNGQNHKDIRFSNNPSGQQQKLNRGVWSMIAGTPERQVAEAGPRVGEHNDTMITQSEPWQQRNAYSFSHSLPSRVEQEVLLNELRSALETYDNMNIAQGSGEMSLMDASRRFLRQHQDYLRQLQQGDCAPDQSSSAARQDYTENSLHLVTAMTQRPITMDGSSDEASQPPQVVIPQQQQQSMQQTTPVTPNLVKEAADTSVQKLPVPSQLEKPTLEPTEAQSEPQSRLRDELQRALEIESRILSSVHNMAPKPLADKRIFGRAPKASLLSSSSLGIDEEVKKEDGGGGSDDKKSGNTNLAFETFNVQPSLAQVEVQGDDASRKQEEGAAKEVEVKAPACGTGWKSVRDPASGKSYYVHIATKKTTWKIEDTFKDVSQEASVKETPVCGAEWRAVTDPNSGRTYYVHRKTKATTWKLEDTLKENGGSFSADLTGLQQKKEKNATEWAERKDPSTGKVYYYNKKTKKTTWKRSETDLDPL